MTAEKEKKAVEQLRSRLHPVAGEIGLEREKLEKDSFLERFLRNNKWNVESAEKMIHFYAKVNGELAADLSRPLKDYPPEIQEIFSRIVVGGWDHEGLRPVLQLPDCGGVDFPAFLDKWGRDEEMTRLLSACYMKFHMVMERLVLEKEADGGIVILNLQAVQYSHYLHKKTIDFFLNQFKLISRHSPQICGKFIIVNAPGIVKMLVSVVQKVVKFPVQVIVLGCGEKDWKSRLQEHVPLHQLCPEFGGTLTTFLEL